MDNIRLIDLNTEIFADNDNCAEEIREQLKATNTFMVNVMASPGSGKTSVILSTIDQLRGQFRTAVVEGDIESSVDSEKIAAAGMQAVQINTRGSCHLDAVVVQKALQGLPLAELDIVFIENIGNLVCPAEFDIGESLKVMILSVPEGDDKIQKYPLMFTVSDALIINKVDYLPDEGFDVERLRSRAKKLNPNIKVFEISCRTGKGVKEWSQWLASQRKTKAKWPTLI